MKNLTIIFLFAMIFIACAFANNEPADTPQATLCSEELKCESDVMAAYNKCYQAYIDGGLHPLVDIACVRDFLILEKDCGECICEIARRENWTIILKSCPAPPTPSTSSVSLTASPQTLFCSEELDCENDVLAAYQKFEQAYID